MNFVKIYLNIKMPDFEVKRKYFGVFLIIHDRDICKLNNSASNLKQGGFQKNKYFSGYEDFVDIFLGSSQNWIIFRVISMQFWVQNFEFQYFWGFSKK